VYSNLQHTEENITDSIQYNVNKQIAQFRYLLELKQREERGSRSSNIAKIKAIDQGIRGIQYLRHLMRQLDLPDINFPTPLMNDNQGSIDWIASGCKPTKKMRHENLAELGITETKKYNEITFHWMAGKTNSADIFTKEDNDVAHYCSLRDLMVVSREQFWNPDSLTDNRWGC